ncbi:MAG: hypothetical protein GXZ05_09805 [Gammaproteobacteria bacterium]|nr:hypothetical protein [Gammaproteobacteria bacterium]
MFDSIISTAIPGRVVRFGISQHGLIHFPPDGQDQLLSDRKDHFIETRAGRRVAVKYDKYSMAYLQKVYRPEFLPRPFLYMHPSAKLEAEDSSGLDWSGYVIFYQGFAGGYLDKYDSAFTPDDFSQGIVLNGRYARAPLRLELMTDALSEVDGFWPDAGSYYHISTDGRFRVFGRLASIRQAIEYSDPASADFPANYFELSAAELSGGSLNKEGLPEIYSSRVSIAQPPQPEKRQESSFELGEIEVLEVRGGGHGGLCYDPDSLEDYYAEVTRIPRNHSTPAYSFSSSGATTPVDAHIDSAGGASFLTLSLDYKTETTREQSVSFLGGGMTTEACDLYGSGDGRTPASVWYSTREQEGVHSESEREITLTGWGESSSAVFTETNERNTTVNSNFLDWSATSTTESQAEFQWSLTFEGQTIMQGDGGASEASLTSYPAIPECVRIQDIGSLPGYFDSQAQIYHVMDAGLGRVVFIRVLPTNLRADGVWALAAHIAEGELIHSGGVSSIEVDSERVIVGRIFGFGKSTPGFEVPTDMIHKKLFIAYDPLEEKFSGIHEYPIFYQ